MDIAYRSDRAVAQLHLDELLEVRRAAGNPLPEVVAEVYAARRARLAGGLVAVAGAAILFGVTFSRAFEKPRARDIESSLDLALAAFDTRSNGDLTAGLMGVLGASLAVTVAVRALAGGWFRGRFVTPPFEPSADPRRDCERLERAPLIDVAEARRIARAGEAWSVALPLMATALLGPFAAHAVVYFGLGRGSAASFDSWMAAALSLVGPSFLVLAICAYRFGRRAGESSSSALRAAGHGGFKALAIATVVSLVPGAWLYLLPTLLVGVTGLAIIPAAHSLMLGRVLDEREKLAVR